MPFPSPSRLEAFLQPYAGAKGHAVRVWGVDASRGPEPVPTYEERLFGHPPRLVLVGAGPEGLAVVRQTHDGMEDLDGFAVPWSSVRRLARDPHLVRDVLRVEVAGHAPIDVAVSNHVLLPSNRAAAKALCDLCRPGHGMPSEAHDVATDLPTGLRALPA
ncbi:MAG: hypothetical protein IT460_09625 [Planctomycetes bacterium]|nr:hypothetical protein [Planctomycetota bacterium]